MGTTGWALTFILTIIVVLISAAIMKWVQNAATSVPKPRRKDKDEEDNG